MLEHDGWAPGARVGAWAGTQAGAQAGAWIRTGKTAVRRCVEVGRKGVSLQVSEEGTGEWKVDKVGGSRTWTGSTEPNLGIFVAVLILYTHVSEKLHQLH